MIDIFKEEYCLAYSKDKFDDIKDIKDVEGMQLILPISAKRERKLFEEFLSCLNFSILSFKTSNSRSEDIPIDIFPLFKSLFCLKV